MDFLDFETTIYHDKVMLLDGIHSRFGLTWPFFLDLNDPRCQDEDYKNGQRQKKKKKVQPTNKTAMSQ